MKKIKAVILKDLFVIKNSVKNLLLIYGLYAFIVFMMRDLFNKMGHIPEKISVFVAMILFVSMGILFVTTGFMRYIINESAVGKEEVYFAYGYSISEVCLGKAIFITALSLVIPYLIVFLFFLKLLALPFFIINIVLILPLFFLAINYLIVFFTWFTKTGTAISIALFFIIFFLFSKVLKKIANLKNIILSYNTILLIEIGVIILFFLIGWIITKTFKKEKLIEKLS